VIASDPLLAVHMTQCMGSGHFGLQNGLNSIVVDQVLGHSHHS